MPKVLEMHFNPPVGKNGNYFFDCRCFCPDKKQEKQLGILCLISEINQASFPEKGLIPPLNKILQKEYYSFHYQDPSDCFKSALEGANNFLDEQKNEFNVALEKINYNAFSLRPDLAVSLAKMGKATSLLFTENNIFDLTKSLTQQSGTGKIFSDIIEGYLEKKDKIFITTQGLYEVFYEQDILRDILPSKNKKQAKKIFKTKKQILKNYQGACLLIFAKGF